MDTTRADEQKHFVTAKADLEQGISEVRNARDVLRDHHGALFLFKMAELFPDVSNTQSQNWKAGMPSIPKIRHSCVCLVFY